MVKKSRYHFSVNHYKDHIPQSIQTLDVMPGQGIVYIYLLMSLFASTQILF